MGILSQKPIDLVLLDYDLGKSGAWSSLRMPEIGALRDDCCWLLQALVMLSLYRRSV